MPNRRTAFLADELYHVFNRGVDRGAIFFGEDNYRYFARLLATKAARDGIRLVAFCLMPTHYHLLVRPASDSAVSRFVNGLAGSYVQAINAARKRVGPLFQGRFRSVHVGRDPYLAHLARYIHLNPVAAGLVVRPQDWPYSNYAAILAGGDTTRDGLLIGGLFADVEAYRRFVEAPQPLELPASLKLAGS